MGFMMRGKVDVLVNHALIVIMNKDRAIIPRSYIAIRDGIIVDVGVGGRKGKV